MYIKRLWDTDEYDVFVGTGWLNWLRVRYVKEHGTEPAKVERVKGTLGMSDGLAKAIAIRINSFQQRKHKAA